ncbi:MAG: acetyl-CoA carboxylase, carboxyltransferase subunit beta [Eubacteriales bacterium]|nr:acetyl-CoA carboxylase, carboxyltransferase subunit beta [Eubacteriales bacterium]
MLKKSSFKRPNNALEGGEAAAEKKEMNEGVCVACPACKRMLFLDELSEALNCCPHCGHHLRLSARERIALTADEGSFAELWPGETGGDPLAFPGYADKLKKAHKASRESESVVTGTCRVGGSPCALFVMEGAFMMGSMGTVTGDKITRLFEYAARENLPVLGFTVSGGARMQEGILSLMQMAKISGAVGRHSDKGLLYLAVLTDPTTGGVTASFAMEADIILAEPGALIGFAGQRVIEQTIRQKLPEGFQRAEFLLEKGFVDAIVPRKEQRSVLGTLLRRHERGSAYAGV